LPSPSKKKKKLTLKNVLFSVLGEKRDINNMADGPQNLLNKSIQLDESNFEEYM
jgi:hypothetical protein